MRKPDAQNLLKLQTDFYDFLKKLLCLDSVMIQADCARPALKLRQYFFVFGRRQMMRILYFEDPLVFVLSSKLFFVVQI